MRNNSTSAWHPWSAVKNFALANRIIVLAVGKSALFMIRPLAANVSHHGHTNNNNEVSIISSDVGRSAEADYRCATQRIMEQNEHDDG